jgi:RHS repeat-associated protein
MPGRHGNAQGAGWTSEGGSTALPQNISYNSRGGNVPLVYKASQSIEFVTGFESEIGDEFTAYITSEGSNGGGEGVDGSEGLYRYGFNGKENDNEVTGKGNQQDYGFRIYDPRLSRFLSTDPLAKSYPMLTPFSFAENQPISSIDLDGLEKFLKIHARDANGFLTTTTIKGIRTKQIKQAVDLQYKNALGTRLTAKDVYEVDGNNRRSSKDYGGQNTSSRELAAVRRGQDVSVNMVDGPADLPYDNTLEEAYRFRRIGPANSDKFDGAKNEFFQFTITHSHLSDDNIALGRGTGDVTTGVFNKRFLLNDNKSIGEDAGILIDNQIKPKLQEFVTNNKASLDNIQLDEVAITTNRESAQHFNLVAKEIEKRLGVRARVIVQNNFTSSRGNVSGEGAYRVTATVSGMQKK